MGKMYHYDGASWEPVKLITYEGGLISGAIDLSDVFGFATNDVFAVGQRIFDNPTPPPNFLDSSLIIHYDGNNWTEVPIVPGRELVGVWGSSNLDVWAGGVEASLYHLEARSWRKYPQTDTSWFSQFGGFSSTDVYALSYAWDSDLRDNTYHYLWHWDGHSWSLDDYFPERYDLPVKFGTSSISVIDGSLYTVGIGLFRRSGTGWENIYTGPQGTYFEEMSGPSNRNVFAVGNNGVVCHYNGSNWYQFPEFVSPTVSYYGVWFDGKEVFVVGNDGHRTYVLHGK
ncbi:MAG: hypothetical protein WB699_18175 [Bacteroidota bacterium]